ncbi:hypothetical protein S7711_08765 [Stachybotrys chartarum IBT 7711]|uniref:Uncharacterized protein n=1 Tax=Stachybotrys chartarum (strain CBS 109288 / IBT 7711) TaxID=1280523 RepID=A0A084AIU9_STACB|nr:hypothetical protein S7711_08765 [Stachybotrys chartarum IBT 7711]KFA47828.1 hypothetical protein S40293_06415 [Stachybotrys chartarum IBT 40293]KFA81043.1 hypothetical protein S40288_00770 [Stachybotrys chartarum IBT 40288]
MPRQGDGSSDNGPFEATNNIIHGPDPVQDTKVPRADKTAELPPGINDKGLAIEGMNASAGSSQGIKKGPNVGQG